jgi:hypothetical protein
LKRLTYGDLLDQLAQLDPPREAEVGVIDLGYRPTEFVAYRVAVAHHPERVQLWGERLAPVDEKEATTLREAP